MRLRSLMIAAIVLHAISVPINAAERGEPISTAERFNIDSKILGETRNYLVHKPERYDQTSDSYPLLVLIFAESNMKHVSASVDFLAASERIPQMLVVGVNVPWASRDLTMPSLDPKIAAEYPYLGGAEKFLAFLDDELIPHIDKNYRTRPHRVLVGHSMGASFSIFALQYKPQLFNAYIAISPTLFNDYHPLVKSAETFFAAHRDLRADFFLTIGDEDTDAVGATMKLAAALEESMPWQERGKPRLLRWQYRHYKDETHFSGRQRSVYEGLQAIFDGWYVHDPFALYDLGGVAALERNYRQVSERVGYPVTVPYSLFSQVAQILVQRNRLDEAEIVLEKAVELHPQSSAAMFALARLYARKKDDARAIELLTRTLRQFPGDEGARRMLVNYKVDVAKIVPPVTLSARELSSYVGAYRAGEISVAISLANDKLIASYPADRFEVRPLAANKFYFVNVETQVTFQKDKRGRVTSVKVERPGSAYELSRVK